MPLSSCILFYIIFNFVLKRTDRTRVLCAFHAFLNATCTFCFHSKIKGLGLFLSLRHRLSLWIWKGLLSQWCPQLARVYVFCATCLCLWCLNFVLSVLFNNYEDEPYKRFQSQGQGHRRCAWAYTYMAYISLPSCAVWMPSLKYCPRCDTTEVYIISQVSHALIEK